MKRIAAAVLLILTLVSQLASCGKTSDNGVSETSSGTAAAYDSDAETSADETLPYELTPVDLGQSDYEGYKFKTVVMENNEAGHIIEEIESESLDGETINDAIYARNLAVMEKFDIEMETIHNSSMASAVKKSTAAGDDAYDLVLPTVYDAFNLAIAGSTLEISELSYIDYSKAWWKSDILDDTSIKHKNYFSVSDLSMHTYGSAQVLAYNKTVAENYGVTDAYELVNSGKWTYDRMIEECKKVSDDSNGNGERDENDVYGIAHLSSSAIIFPYSADLFFVHKDSDDVPYIELTDKFVTFFQKMVNDFSDDSFSMYTEKFGSAKRITAGSNGFMENRVLLYRLDLSYITDLRVMETDFGIIPTPKYDEAQESYITVIHPGAMSAITVPVTSSDLDRTSKIIEELSYQSYIYTKPAYIEVAIKTKYSRDEESIDMLNIILDNFRLDLAFAFADSGLSITGDMRTLLGSFDSDVVSQFEKKSAKYTEKLNSIVESLG